jgi:hypothetical protein
MTSQQKSVFFERIMKDDLLLGRILPGSAFAHSPILARYTNAEEHLLFVLVGFAGSVVVTRSFLKWTGYPQIAGGEFHIAHVLWGGLLLFVAALLLLIWRGRIISRFSSILTGVGFGLFIDEVGKFITKSNDYFYPLAAPLIYAFFLLTVFVYLRLRRSRANGARAELYTIFDLLEQGLDGDLRDEEYQRIKARLQVATRSANPRAARLAGHALAFLEAEAVHTKTSHHNSARQWWTQPSVIVTRWFTRSRLRRALILGFAILALRGIASAVAALLFVVAISNPERWQQMAATSTPLSSGGPFGTTHLLLVSITLIFEGIIGALFLAATGLMVGRRMRRGLTLGYWGLLFSLTAVHFLMFYFNQFDVILTTLFQFGLLLGVLRYRSSYLD